MSENDPDSPDAIDLTKGDGHWTDERDREADPPKDLEELTPEEIREQYPNRAEEIIDKLKDVDGSKVAEVLDGE